MVFGHFSYVEQCIAHASEGRVDTYLCGVGYLLEAHVFVVSHDKHFALVLGQSSYQSAYVGVYLAGDDGVFYGTFAQLLAVEDVFFFVFTVRYEILVPFLSVVVDNEVVGDAGYPRRKFARLYIAALLDGRYYLDKGLLEDIFGEIIVFDGVEYVRVDTIFVSCQQDVECLVVTL